MATKLYPNRDYYTDWVSDPLTLKGGWDATTGSNPARLHFSPIKENTGVSAQFFKSSLTAPYRAATKFGVSPRLQAQTVSGTVNPMVFAKEGNAAHDCFLRLHVWVTVGDTNAVRGTLLNQFEDAVTEFAVAAQTAQRFGSAQTLTPVAVQDGDRIAIELGWVQLAVGTNTFDIGTTVGTRYQNGDATVGSTAATGSTALNQYIEFSADLLFKPGPGNDTCATATAVSTFPYSATIDTTDSAPVNAPNLVGSCSNWGDDTLPVWWKLTGLAAGADLTIHTGGSAYQTIVSLWRGSCGALTQVACAANPTAGAPLAFGPTTGIDYYVLVNRDANTGTGPGGSLSIAITATAAAPAGCSLAVTIPSIPYTVVNLDTTVIPTADLTPVLTCCERQTHMQWYAYTPATAHQLYLTAAGTAYDHAIAVFTGACPGGPWTQLVCRWGNAATPARISVPVTAGTLYWIVTAADDWDVAHPNPGGLLNLFVGDTAAAGLIQPGETGAVEWEGNYTYHDCNGEPEFLQILDASGNALIYLKLFQAGACFVGDTTLIDVSRMVVYAGGTLPGIPLTAYNPPAPCAEIGMTTLYGHRDFVGAPGYNGPFRFRFRLSSRDTVNGGHLADAYMEVTWPYSTFGTYRWDNLTINGSTWQGFSFHPGFWTDRVYLRKQDEYSGWNAGASDLVWYRDFTAIPGTEAELFAEFGGLFTRVIHGMGNLNPANPLPAAPRLDSVGRPTYFEPGNASVSCFCALRRVTAFPPYVPPVIPPLVVGGAPPVLGTGIVNPGTVAVVEEPPPPPDGGFPIDDPGPGGSCPVTFVPTD